MLLLGSLPASVWVLSGASVCQGPSRPGGGLHLGHGGHDKSRPSERKRLSRKIRDLDTPLGAVLPRVTLMGVLGFALLLHRGRHLFACSERIPDSSVALIQS